MNVGVKNHGKADSKRSKTAQLFSRDLNQESDRNHINTRPEHSNIRMIKPPIYSREIPANTYHKEQVEYLSNKSNDHEVQERFLIEELNAINKDDRDEQGECEFEGPKTSRESSGHVEYKELKFREEPQDTVNKFSSNTFPSEGEGDYSGNHPHKIIHTIQSGLTGQSKPISTVLHYNHNNQNTQSNHFNKESPRHDNDYKYKLAQSASNNQNHLLSGEGEDNHYWNLDNIEGKNTESSDKNFFYVNTEENIQYNKEELRQLMKNNQIYLKINIKDWEKEVKWANLVEKYKENDHGIQSNYNYEIVKEAHIANTNMNNNTNSNIIYNSNNNSRVNARQIGNFKSSIENIIRKKQGKRKWNNSTTPMIEETDMGVGMNKGIKSQKLDLSVKSIDADESRYHEDPTSYNRLNQEEQREYDYRNVNYNNNNNYITNNYYTVPSKTKSITSIPGDLRKSNEEYKPNVVQGIHSPQQSNLQTKKTHKGEINFQENNLSNENSMYYMDINYINYDYNDNLKKNQERIKALDRNEKDIPTLTTKTKYSYPFSGPHSYIEEEKEEADSNLNDTLILDNMPSNIDFNQARTSIPLFNTDALIKKEEDIKPKLKITTFREEPSNEEDDLNNNRLEKVRFSTESVRYSKTQPFLGANNLNNKAGDSNSNNNSNNFSVHNTNTMSNIPSVLKKRMKINTTYSNSNNAELENKSSEPRMTGVLNSELSEVAKTNQKQVLASSYIRIKKLANYNLADVLGERPHNPEFIDKLKSPEKVYNSGVNSNSNMNSDSKTKYYEKPCLNVKGQFKGRSGAGAEKGEENLGLTKKLSKNEVIIEGLLKSLGSPTNTSIKKN
eukprot:CAMPEP_0170523896 /NCGR_PEP_ID=MMETSP0209-20121228/9324_1 /TAXON_ID=665100 ORGANISM="Litonotus pictus, Strain P1" /NCGR_SAMPLE_ID=MMETSP0209 /ASSEMBLY_ACC=CAM_ASM_000301 /LENGTH=840 /DNA_ID=CAMNT_0010812257 /DNA_START=273 /DNA_END=2792 /DNA_ORIENTATION=-